MRKHKAPGGVNAIKRDNLNDLQIWNNGGGKYLRTWNSGQTIISVSSKSLDKSRISSTRVL